MEMFTRTVVTMVPVDIAVVTMVTCYDGSHENYHHDNSS